MSRRNTRPQYAPPGAAPRRPGAGRFARLLGRLLPAVAAVLVGVAVAPLLSAPPARAAVPGGYGERRLDEITLLDSHNGFSNGHDGIDFARNQTVSLRDQVQKFQVRGTELDIYPSGEKVRLCHGDCRGGSRDVTLALNEIVTMLNENRGEVFVIRFEDYVKDEALLAEVLRYVPGLTDLTFRPDSDQWKVRERGWPKVKDMVRANKRLLMFSDVEGRADIGLPFIGDYIVQNHYEGLACRDRGGYSKPMNTPLRNRFQPLLLINQFHDGDDETNVYENIRDRIGNCTHVAGGRVPNIISFDDVQSQNEGPRRFVQSLNNAPSWSPDGGRLCLDTDQGGTANGTKVQMWTCNWSTPQAWRRVPHADGFELRALGKCLDVSAADGLGVRLWDCNGSTHQRWSHRNGALVNHAVNKCLVPHERRFTEGQPVVVWACDGGGQRWDWRLR
ncbi:ricin-type beta-trefoil lectin domain protein [Streptomyces sp. NPDC101132]|uniref:ricin-type beta-trefoil lectin domain protein n=1 Tax=Streptomyces sp. NPDC101132 TaxID=3366110 RepID=UPI00381347B0